MVAKYVEVAVGLPVPGTFCYSVPLPLARPPVGSRVLVPFGRRGVTGVVVRTPETAPEGVEVRELRRVLDEAGSPALPEELTDLCVWVADYYEAPPGEALRLALPAGTQESSRTRLVLTDAGRAAVGGEGGALAPKLRALLVGLAAGKPPRDAARAQALVQAGLAAWAEDSQEARVKARKVTRLRLVADAVEASAVLTRAPKQLAVVHALAAAPGGLLLAPELEAKVPGSAAAVRALVAAGRVARDTAEVSRDPWAAEPAPVRDALPVPTAGQAAALEVIGASLSAREYRAFLLHGVTGSGKTEVYLRVIADALDQGRNAIVLVPEIALTPQLASRFRARFGDQVAVLHSGLTPGERFDQWRRLRSGQARIALGARSAVFAPLDHVGVIVVDEEHDGSFKQEEGVRYHARDVALVRAKRAGAVCVLGSATPSMESYANAREGRFTLVELPERPVARPMPIVDVIDMRVWKADGEAFLTAPLAAAIGETLAAGEQTILFLNRRGYSTFTVCVSCGVPRRCPDCSVSLTYHRGENCLRCHYCGHHEAAPESCPDCGAEGSLRRMGLGTEKIEAGLRERFPAARIARLDRDTAKGRGLVDVLRRMNAGEIDILVGTQMVTKGHDFPRVTLVGVLSADTGLAMPDFRAAERTFQLLTQVAGRAGRGERPGRVLVQTYTPTHPAIRAASAHDFGAFFAEEDGLRRELSYPPHGKLMAVRLDGADESAVVAAAHALRARGQELLAGGDAGVSVLGPAEAPLRRLKGKHRWHLWVKAADRLKLRSFVRRLLAGMDPAGVRLTLDVDPLSAL